MAEEQGRGGTDRAGARQCWHHAGARVPSACRVAPLRLLAATALRSPCDRPHAPRRRCCDQPARTCPESGIWVPGFPVWRMRCTCPGREEKHLPLPQPLIGEEGAAPPARAGGEQGLNAGARGRGGNGPKAMPRARSRPPPGPARPSPHWAAAGKAAVGGGPAAPSVCPGRLTLPSPPRTWTVLATAWLQGSWEGEGGKGQWPIWGLCRLITGRTGLCRRQCPSRGTGLCGGRGGGQTDGQWVDGQVDEQMDGWTDEWTDG